MFRNSTSYLIWSHCYFSLSTTEILSFKFYARKLWFGGKFDFATTILPKGAFFNYVDKILAFFDHLPTLSWHLWRNSFTVSIRENLYTIDISSITYLPTLFVNVVKDCPPNTKGVNEVIQSLQTESEPISRSLCNWTLFNDPILLEYFISKIYILPFW